MIIKKITLFKISLELKQPFETSFSRLETRNTVIVKIETNSGVVGYGEAPTLSLPFYNEEYTDGAYSLLENVICPRLINQPIDSIDDLYRLIGWIKLNNIAKTGIESAYWDAQSQIDNVPLWKLWGGTRKEIPVGISLGIEQNIEEMMEKVSHWVEVEKVMRIKIKIKPGMDFKITQAIRKKYPDVSLMLDANSAYSLDDIELFKRLDEFNLLMIEQPLAHDDIIDHATLQSRIKTPICLDESIISLDKARKAIDVKACKIINIKPPRVGGYWQAKLIAEYCEKRGIPVWCGGMMDSGLGRVFQLHTASLNNFSLPNDNAGTKRYFKQDIMDKSLVVKKSSHIAVPDKVGLGFSVNPKMLEKVTREKTEIA